MNALLRQAIEQTGRRFRCAFSISGTALDAARALGAGGARELPRPGATGCVEFLCETAHHSLAALCDPEEFRAQVATAARDASSELFGVAPDDLPQHRADHRRAHRAGRSRTSASRPSLGEGADHLLGWRSPHRRLPARAAASASSLLLRSYRFSDDIAFRFSNREWAGVAADGRQVRALARRACPRRTPFVGLFMDYETFGEHQWTRHRHLRLHASTCPAQVLANPRLRVPHAGEVARAGARPRPRRARRSPTPVSWADAERDLSAWLGNDMQRAAHAALYALAPAARAAARAGARELLRGLAPAHDLRPPLLHVHQVVLRRRRAQVLQPLRPPPRRLHHLHERARRPRARASRPPRHEIPRRRRLQPARPVRGQLGGLQQGRRHLHRRSRPRPRPWSSASATTTSRSGPGCSSRRDVDGAVRGGARASRSSPSRAARSACRCASGAGASPAARARSWSSSRACSTKKDDDPRRALGAATRSTRSRAAGTTSSRCSSGTPPGT